MTIYLKQSTASQEIPLGIFVDSTDGNSAEDALTIANTDIKLWKTGATTLANKNSGGATHISGGIYYAVLDATDTDTLGPLVVFCHPTGALAVKVDCVVLAANVYDSMVAGSANLAVDAVAISGDTVAADNLEAAADGTGFNLGNGDIVAASVTGAVGSVTGNVTLADGHITAAKIATDAITDEKLAASAAVEIAAAVWDRVLTGATHNIASSAGRRLRAIPDSIASTINDVTPSALEFDTALAGGYSNDHFNDQLVRFTSGSASGEVGVIVDYVDATGTITLDEPLANTPSNGDSFEIVTDHVHPKSQIADVILDELLSGHSTAGTLGKAVTDILGDTAEMQADLVDGGRLDLLIDAIKAKTDNLPASPGDVSYTDTVEGAVTVLGLLRHMLAFLGGTTEGANTTNPRFKSQDGLTDRISMTVDSDGERTAVTLDAS